MVYEVKKQSFLYKVCFLSWTTKVSFKQIGFWGEKQKFSQSHRKGLGEGGGTQTKVENMFFLFFVYL